MRIAFISQGMGGIHPPYARGSVAIWTLEIAKRLADRGITVFAFEFGDTFFHVRRLTWGGINFVYVPSRFNRIANRLHTAVCKTLSRLKFVPKKPHIPVFASPFHDLLYAIFTGLSVYRARCDIVHVQTMTQTAVIIKMINRHALTVMHMHGEWISQLDAAMMQRRLRYFDLVLGCSAHITTAIAHRFPAFASHCTTVCNGVDTSHFKPASNSTGNATNSTARVLFVGRVSPEKGVHILTKAFSQIAHRFPDVSLDIVGGIASLPYEFIAGLSTDRQIQTLHRFYAPGVDYRTALLEGIDAETQNRITFTGPLHQTCLLELYQRATLFAVASLSESFCMPIIEAMACGVPVIASRTGGIPELIVNGVTGRLVQPGNVAAFAETMADMLQSDPSTLHAMGTAGRERVENLFSWERISESLMTSYANVLTPAHRGTFASAAPVQ